MLYPDSGAVGAIAGAAGGAAAVPTSGDAAIDSVVDEDNQEGLDPSLNKTTTSDSLEQETMMATAAPGQPVPTGTALENMPSSQNAPAPVINNVTNNSGGGASKEPRVVVANAPTPRPNTNTIERYQDRRYRG